MMKQPVTELDLELSRLAAEYRRRDFGNISSDAARYSLFNESALLLSQSLERNLLNASTLNLRTSHQVTRFVTSYQAIGDDAYSATIPWKHLALLKQHKFTDLAEKKILDVGCGNGGHLRRFLEYGAIPTNLHGIDLMAQRIEQAQRSHPMIDWRVGSAHELPYPDASFDLVMSFVLFSSILHEQLRQKIADEMWRVTKPGGIILFYDFVYSNPRNSAVRGITRKQIRELFKRPGVRFDFRRVILAPPIARVLAPHAYWLAYSLECLKILNTHTIGIISLEEI